MSQALKRAAVAVMITCTISSLKYSSCELRTPQSDIADVDEPTQTKRRKYIPSYVEKYLVENSDALGFASKNNPSTCQIWSDPAATGDPGIHDKLSAYAADLARHNEAIMNFKSVNFSILDSVQKNSSHNMCSSLRLHPDGLSGIFPSNQLSLSKSGWIEPLTPPMRFHKFCNDPRHLMSLDYLVHDFEAMCLNIKSTSQRVLIDMGASLDFHGKTNQPIVTLLSLYEKFGFHFDHIYAFEINHIDPKRVFEDLLPEKYLKSYHWINTGVSHEERHRMNPLNSILSKFTEDDFVIVKLDIDTSSVEVPLVRQLLEGGPGGIYHSLVDQFYFEHHVHLGELHRYWGKSMNGTVKESLEIFYALREKGIPAHYWP